MAAITIDLSHDEWAALIHDATVAPELLSELRNMVEVYWGAGDGYEPPPDCIVRAKAVIAKAEAAS